MFDVSVLFHLSPRSLSANAFLPPITQLARLAQLRGGIVAREALFFVVKRIDLYTVVISLDIYSISQGIQHIYIYRYRCRYRYRYRCISFLFLHKHIDPLRCGTSCNGGFLQWGYLNSWMVYFMEPRINMDDLAVPLFFGLFKDTSI